MLPVYLLVARLRQTLTNKSKAGDRRSHFLWLGIYLLVGGLRLKVFDKAKEADRPPHALLWAGAVSDHGSRFASGSPRLALYSSRGGGVAVVVSGWSAVSRRFALFCLFFPVFCAIMGSVVLSLGLALWFLFLACLPALFLCCRPALPWVFPVPALSPRCRLPLSVPFLPSFLLRPAFLLAVRLGPMPLPGGCSLRPGFSPLRLVGGGLAVLPLPVGRWLSFLLFCLLAARPVCGVSSLRPAVLLGCCLRPGLPVAFVGWGLGLGPLPPLPWGLACRCWPFCPPLFPLLLAGGSRPWGVAGGWPALSSSCPFLASAVCGLACFCPAIGGVFY